MGLRAVVLVLTAALMGGTPTPAPQPAPAHHRYIDPEVHYAIEYAHAFVVPSGNGWMRGNGNADLLQGQIEFPVTNVGRFSFDTQYRELHSRYTYAYGGKWYAAYWDHRAWMSELDWEFGSPANPLYGAGIGYLQYNPISDNGEMYVLRGTGIGIDRWPDFTRRVSVYASVWYYPSVKPGIADYDSFGIWKYDAGVNVRATDESPLSIKLGYSSEVWNGKTSGGSFEFAGPSVSLTYWR